MNPHRPTHPLCQLAMMLFVANFVFGCQTGRLYIETIPPGANIYLIGEGSRTAIGHSPIELTLNPDQNKIFTEIEVEQKGHQTHSLLIPESHHNSTHRINIILKPSTDAETFSESYSIVQVTNLITTLKDSETAINNNDAETADKLLRGIRATFGSISAVQRLEAKVELANGNHEKAYLHFKNAIESDPSNVTLTQEFEAAFPNNKPGVTQ